ncbi:DUF6551 family protein [Rhodobium gokarnense]|uniref:ParB/Sulfiredoxin domain-containing protein n=1 Tax=Rhodobium gokarnense TaxID=364296 RepID=A0ABT3HH15_9HYPH|nr:DUF6551 family protein [Rhodobium gokarnense]MCW2309681.1 hypothetical protein [Rhodobium gokarnense]
MAFSKNDWTAAKAEMRRIAAMQFPDISPGMVSETAPVLRDADPLALLVDESYQRNLGERSVRLIRKILSAWDWRAFKPPVVVEVDGDLHVIDGQHTAIAAASHPEIKTIPVLLVDGGAVEDRATAFVKHNRDRIAITPMQLFYARLKAGDEDALTISQVCERAGVRVLKYPPANGRYKEGDTVAVATLEQLIRRRYVVGARKVLDVLVEARQAPVQTAAIKAVETLLFAPEYAGQVDPGDIATTLRRLGRDAERQAALLAQEHRVPLWRALVTVLFRNTRKIRGRQRSS